MYRKLFHFRKAKERPTIYTTRHHHAILFDIGIVSHASHTMALLFSFLSFYVTFARSHFPQGLFRIFALSSFFSWRHAWVSPPPPPSQRTRQTEEEEGPIVRREKGSTCGERGNHQDMPTFKSISLGRSLAIARPK